MAKGNKCMECGEVAYADTEEYQEKGTWVTYVCLNGTCLQNPAHSDTESGGIRTAVPVTLGQQFQ